MGDRIGGMRVLAYTALMLLVVACARGQVTPSPAPGGGAPAAQVPAAGGAAPGAASPGQEVKAATPSPTRPGVPAATPAPAPGTVEVRVTDAPPEGVTKVMVYASKIEVQRAGADGEAGWATILESPLAFDLVAVSGMEEVLGTSKLPEGSYSQVRLAITRVAITLRGQEREAEVPSEKLRVVGTFTVAAGKTTVLTLDFDADKSVVVAGARVNFKPVVKLLKRDPAEKPEAPKRATTPTLTPTAPVRGPR
ncbi:MAG: DUF4382 domain-containing protein [Chloroflexi bacterium]|nr:DUF4382 domain-containing protein [Chloroflexota bacterium]